LWLEPDTTSKRAGALPSRVSRTTTVPVDDAWIERWGRASPSISWNDVALELVVKYQQNPLRAARMLALLHAAMHDALVVCARDKCSPVATRIAMHAAAGHVLAHMYPQETPGRLQALALSASSAALAVQRDERFDPAWEIGKSGAAQRPPQLLARWKTAPTGSGRSRCGRRSARDCGVRLRR
jgi:hypothetical protein